jgi:hypothetical protein
MKFLKISPEVLSQGTQYNFNIFMYNAKSSLRYPVLYIGEELKESTLNSWAEQIIKGDTLQGLIVDKTKILEETSITPDGLERQNEFNFKLLRKQISRLKDNLGKHNSEYSYLECIEEVDRRKNTKPLTLKVQSEVLCYPLYLSQNISTATGIIEYLGVCEEDILLFVCICFVVAKDNRIEEAEQLSELIIIASIVDLGNIKLCGEKNINECRHSIASTIYIAKQAGLNLCRECKKYLIDFHNLRAKNKTLDEVSLVSRVIFTAQQVFADYKKNEYSLKESFKRNKL